MHIARLLSRFRRVTTSGNYIGEVDGIRFVAIGAVFLHHVGGDIVRHSTEKYARELAADVTNALVAQLSLGVQLFFVLSGFILGLPFANQYLAGESRVPLKRYFLRRLTRLEPPYVAAMLLFFALKLLGARGTFQGLLPHLAASLLYTHYLIFRTASDINLVAWSLEIEVQFYLLAPLLARLLFGIRDTRIRRTSIAAACMGMAVVAWALPFSSGWQISIVGQGTYFLAGLLLADVYCTRNESEKPHWLWDVLCVGALLFLLLSRLLAYRSWLLVSPLTIAVSYYAVFRSVWVRRLLAWAPIATIGGMCYSIYLLHHYIIALCGFLSERIGNTLPFTARLGIQSAIMAVPVLCVSSIFYLAIEHPCMRPDWPWRLRQWLAARLGAASSMDS